MADEDTEPREPDQTQETSTANAGSALQPSDFETTAEVPRPDFDAMNRAISETRKQAGPPFPEVSPDEALRELDESEEEDIAPTDPS